MIQFILMDIEGTTTSIAFVHEVLFPFASQHLPQFILEHQEEDRILEALEDVKKTVLEETGKTINNKEAISQLIAWIKADRKHTALKTLQGYLWKSGYETKQYKGHIYDDVPKVLEQWHAAGKAMGIYSSGSVEAQQLLFSFSDKGDLTPYLSAYFDTKIGHKREVQSYQNIQQSLAVPPENILFLSDVGAELDAAQAAGFQTIQLVRPGTKPSLKHRTVADFEAINI